MRSYDPARLYLDQNYLSGIAKEKAAFRELEPVLRAAVDAADLDALAQALTHADLVTCDAFMADVVRRARLDLRHRCEVFSGRRPDVLRLRNRINELGEPL